jgi:hypothetical protein
MQYTRRSTNSPQTKRYGWQTPISPRKSANREESRGLVKMSANCLSVSIYLISMPPFSTWSLRKWCLLSTCLFFLWKTGFLATEMALVLSHMRGTLSNLTPKSLIVCTIQRICEQPLATATYSASVVDYTTEDCFGEDRQMREDPRKWQVPEVLFRSIPQPAKSVSENPTRSSEEEAEYQIPNSGVCLRYLKTH